jgi:hypothetical protein
MKTYKKIQLQVQDDGTVNAPGEIIAVESFGMNTVTVLVDMSEPHRLAFAEPPQQPSLKATATETGTPALETLEYRELQTMAVEHGVKGNLPREEMIEAIREARDA